MGTWNTVPTNGGAILCANKPLPVSCEQDCLYHHYELIFFDHYPLNLLFYPWSKSERLTGVQYMRGYVAGALLCAIALQGCTSTSLNTALGTPKNPTPIFSDPQNKVQKDDQSLFILGHYGVLLEAIEKTSLGYTIRVVPDDYDMRRYLAAGYALADTYCSRYFAKTDEASRRRRFGRTLTNDVGTAASTIAGLANASKAAISGLAAVTGLSDSAWRNYDDSFVISPDLATVRSLVGSNQDNYRARTLSKDSELPADFGTAHSVIRKYAEICSHLGMKTLLEQSAKKEQAALDKQTEGLTKPINNNGGQGTPLVTPPASVSPGDTPVTAMPTLAPNKSN